MLQLSGRVSNKVILLLFVLRLPRIKGCFLLVPLSLSSYSGEEAGKPYINGARLSSFHPVSQLRYVIAHASGSYERFRLPEKSPSLRPVILLEWVVALSFYSFEQQKYDSIRKDVLEQEVCQPKSK